MRSGHGPPWGNGARPPWWPESEAWPPHGRWRRPPRAFFFRAIGCVVVAFVVLQVVAAATLSVVAGVFGVGGITLQGSLAVGVVLLVMLVAIGAIASASGMVRRAAAPIGDLMSAVDRVAEGDYETRVEPRGPRQVRRLVGSFNAMAERLARGEQQRRRLLADVTHELGTPLAVIQGQVEGVLDGVYPRDDEHLGAILNETRHMARIVEDLRMLSLAESGALKLRREPSSLTEIVEDAVDTYGPEASAAGVILLNTVPIDLPAVDVDPTRVREVLTNLVSNAIRYTPRGGEVTVSAHRDGPSHIAVTVRDTGKGLGPEETSLIFERFHRSADSRGSGLGLAIARDLVRAHGGDISASSDGAGRGTAIRFTLPIAL